MANGDQRPERVVSLDVPWLPDAASPSPVLIEDEYSAVVVYRTAEEVGKLAVLVGFPGCRITRFGHPDAKALPSHPLYELGLSYHGVYEVLGSSWPAQLLDPDGGRPLGSAAGPRLRHFVITFADSTFECLADDLRGQFTDNPLAEAHALLLTLRPTGRRQGSPSAPDA